MQATAKPMQVQWKIEECQATCRDMTILSFSALLLAVDVESRRGHWVLCRRGGAISKTFEVRLMVSRALVTRNIAPGGGSLISGALSCEGLLAHISLGDYGNNTISRVLVLSCISSLSDQIQTELTRQDWGCPVAESLVYSWALQHRTPGAMPRYLGYFDWKSHLCIRVSSAKQLVPLLATRISSHDDNGTLRVGTGTISSFPPQPVALGRPGAVVDFHVEVYQTAVNLYGFLFFFTALVDAPN
ncbi:hypothetical protein EDC04DRAFT_2597721 [Pisolithus marmoratus]|nr:hypothetical protein EDC04DRAFT_2597721 [Pisolithus marmoratus]